MGLAGTRKVLWALLAALLAWGARAQAQTGRAVVVVGPVDPPVHEETRACIAEAQSLARILERAGYGVQRLYHPRATWDRVRRAAGGADVLVYYGHGNGRGWMGHTDSEAINGLCLSDAADPNIMYAGMGVPGGNARDLESLELAPDSTVALVHACYASGSSKADRRAVDYETARARVMSYAQTFFRAGARYYFATAYVGVAPDYFRRWTRGAAPDRAFLEATPGRVIRGSGFLLAEQRSAPDEPCPWAAAWVGAQTGREPGTATGSAPSPHREEGAAPRFSWQVAAPRVAATGLGRPGRWRRWRVLGEGLRDPAPATGEPAAPTALWQAARVAAMEWPHPWEPLRVAGRYPAPAFLE